MEQNKPDLSVLDDDGATLDLGNGRTLRLSIVPDDINPFEDADCYGKIAEVVARRYQEERGRPDGFDGNAEKITLRDGRYWWQPPADGPKRGTDEFEKFRAHVIELANDGYVQVILEMLEGTDAYGKGIVRDHSFLGGIDGLEDGYLAQVVSELWAEIEHSAAMRALDAKKRQVEMHRCWNEYVFARAGMAPGPRMAVVSEADAFNRLSAAFSKLTETWDDA